MLGYDVCAIAAVEHCKAATKAVKPNTNRDRVFNFMLSPVRMPPLGLHSDATTCRRLIPYRS